MPNKPKKIEKLELVGLGIYASGSTNVGEISKLMEKAIIETHHNDTAFVNKINELIEALNKLKCK